MNDRNDKYQNRSARGQNDKNGKGKRPYDNRAPRPHAPQPKRAPMNDSEELRDFSRPSGQEEIGNGAVIGRNAVRELLNSERTVDKLLVRRGDREGSIVALIAQAKEKGIPVIEVDRTKLDEMAGTAPHQGIIALAAEKDYVEPEDILRIAEERGEPPLIAIADGITDPYNLGALIRCAEGLGAHGLIIPKRRAVGLTPLVTKASAGAIEHLAVAKVTNLAQTVKMLQERGVWVYAAEAGGSDYDKTNFRGPCALIFGSEGDGVSALLKERCDGIVSIPMKGKVNSFNVSTAAAILLAEAARQHRMAAIEQGGEG